MPTKIGGVVLLMSSKNKVSELQFMKGLLIYLASRQAKAYRLTSFMSGDALGDDRSFTSSGRDLGYLVVAGGLSVIVPLDKENELFKLFSASMYDLQPKFSNFKRTLNSISARFYTERRARSCSIDDIFWNFDNVFPRTYLDYSNADTHKSVTWSLLCNIGVVDIQSVCSISMLRKLLPPNKADSLGLIIIDIATSERVVATRGKYRLHELHFNNSLVGYRVYGDYVAYDISIEDFKKLGIPKPLAGNIHGVTNLVEKSVVSKVTGSKDIILVSEGEMQSQQFANSDVSDETWLYIFSTLKSQ